MDTAMFSLCYDTNADCNDVSLKNEIQSKNSKLTRDCTAASTNLNYDESWSLSDGNTERRNILNNNSVIHTCERPAPVFTREMFNECFTIAPGCTDIIMTSSNVARCNHAMGTLEFDAEWGYNPTTQKMERNVKVGSEVMHTCQHDIPALDTDMFKSCFVGGDCLNSALQLQPWVELIGDDNIVAKQCKDIKLQVETDKTLQIDDNWSFIDGNMQRSIRNNNEIIHTCSRTPTIITSSSFDRCFQKPAHGSCINQASELQLLDGAAADCTRIREDAIATGITVDGDWMWSPFGMLTVFQGTYQRPKYRDIKNINNEKIHTCIWWFDKNPIQLYTRRHLPPIEDYWSGKISFPISI